MPTVVGIDPSLTGTGIARSDGLVRTIGQEGVTKLPIQARSLALRALAGRVVDMLRGPLLVPDAPPGVGVITSIPRRIDLVVMELPHIGGPFGGQLERVGLFWEILNLLDHVAIPFATPTQAQRCSFLLGKGSGTKGAIIDAVTRRWPEYGHGGDDNVADAVVYMQLGRARLGEDTGVPQAHLKVLDKITWPEGLSNA